MNVTAIIVTRGDHDLSDILDSLPTEWERIVWDNGFHGYPHADIYKDGNDWRPDGPPGEVRDLSVYGRYAAIEYAKGDLIYVQDDDVLVRDPQAIVRGWNRYESMDHVVCNMPQEFRHSFYEDHALVGFGACFHRDAPRRAFERMPWPEHFVRTCDIVFTSLTPRVLVDVPKRNLPWANDDNRMWMQPKHQAERSRMLDLCKEARYART